MKRRWKIRNPQFRAFLYLLPARQFSLRIERSGVCSCYEKYGSICGDLGTAWNHYGIGICPDFKFQYPVSEIFQKCIFSSICHIDDRSGCCVAVDAQQRLWNGQCTSLSAWDAKSSVAYRCAHDHPDLDCIKCVERAWL